MNFTDAHKPKYSKFSSDLGRPQIILFLPNRPIWISVGDRGKNGMGWIVQRTRNYRLRGKREAIGVIHREYKNETHSNKNRIQTVEFPPGRFSLPSDIWHLVPSRQIFWTQFFGPSVSTISGNWEEPEKNRGKPAVLHLFDISTNQLNLKSGWLFVSIRRFQGSLSWKLCFYTRGTKLKEMMELQFSVGAYDQNKA